MKESNKITKKRNNFQKKLQLNQTKDLKKKKEKKIQMKQTIRTTKRNKNRN